MHTAGEASCSVLAPIKMMHGKCRAVLSRDVTVPNCVSARACPLFDPLFVSSQGNNTTDMSMRYCLTNLSLANHRASVVTSVRFPGLRHVSQTAISRFNANPRGFVPQHAKFFLTGVAATRNGISAPVRARGAVRGRGCKRRREMDGRGERQV